MSPYLYPNQGLRVNRGCEGVSDLCCLSPDCGYSLPSVLCSLLSDLIPQPQPNTTIATTLKIPADLWTVVVVAALLCFRVKPDARLAEIVLFQHREMFVDRRQELVRQKLAFVIRKWRMPLLQAASAARIAGTDRGRFHVYTLGRRMAAGFQMAWAVLV